MGDFRNQWGSQNNKEDWANRVQSSAIATVSTLDDVWLFKYLMCFRALVQASQLTIWQKCWGNPCINGHGKESNMPETTSMFEPLISIKIYQTIFDTIQTINTYNLNFISLIFAHWKQPSYTIRSPSPFKGSHLQSRHTTTTAIPKIAALKVERVEPLKIKGFTCGWPLVENEGMNPYMAMIGMILPSFPTKGQPD